MKTAVSILFVAALALSACTAPGAPPTSTPGPSPTPQPSPSPSPTAPPPASPSVPPAGGPLDPADLAGRTFLSTRVTQAGEDLELVEGTRISVRFEVASIGLQAGCNQMGGAITFDDDVLVVVDGLSMTEMGCDPPRHDQDDWLAGFAMARPIVSLAGDELTLSAGDTTITLLDEEVAAPDAPLVGTTWVVESIITGEMVSSVPLGVEATLVFGEDGRYTVDTGCNSGGGTYQADPAGTLTIAPPALTRMACQGPPGDMESAVVPVLGAGELAWSIDVDVLQLSAGPLGLGLRAAS